MTSLSARNQTVAQMPMLLISDNDLERSSIRLSTQRTYLLEGVFKATLMNATRCIETSIIVIKGKINSPPLIREKTLIGLEMIEIRPDGSIKDENEHRIGKLSQ